MRKPSSITWLLAAARLIGSNPLPRTALIAGGAKSWRRGLPYLAAGLILSAFVPHASAQTSYTSTTATTAWNAARWNNSADGPTYTSTFTLGQAVNFTSGTYTFAGMGAPTNVGNVTVASGVSVTVTTGSTYATGGLVQTINIGSGGLFDLQGAISTAAGTGFIKSGAGVLAIAGGNYLGGFTLNAGTVIARGTTGLGSGTTNTLVLNGGTIAANDNRAFANTRFGGGITIGGNVQFGELSTIVALALSTANLSFANNVSLGGANRILTSGNNGSNTFSAIISNTGSGGITFAANANTDGRFEITNAANTFTGDVGINGGEVRFTADGSIGNAANDIIIDGGRFGKASDTTTVTLGAGRDIYVGDGAGTSISSASTGTLIYNNAIANKVGETGSWAKQGGGTLELGGVSTYTGNTFINNGFLKLTIGNDRLPTGTVVSLGQAASPNVGTFNLNGLNQQIAGLASTTGTNSSANKNTVTSTTAATLTISVANGVTHTYGDGTAANSGVITGALSLTKSGSGTQVLGDANTFTGTTTVSGGTLTAGSGALAGSTGIAVNGAVLSAVNLKTTATLALDATGKATISGTDLTIGATTNANATDANALNFSSNTGAITVDSLAGAGKTTFGSAATITGGIAEGTVTVTGALTSTAVSGGTVNLNGATSTITSFTGGTINLSATTLTVNGGTSASAITGANGNLVKATTGILTLSGTQTYGGTTTVNAGELIINGALASGSAVSVNNTGTLGGAGTVGAVTVNTGGTISPGNSPGTLNTGAVTFAAGGNYNWQLLNATGTAGTGFDFINSTGSLTISATSGSPFNLNLWTLSGSSTNGSALNFSPNTSYSWLLGSFGGGITGFDGTNFTVNTAATNGTTGFANTLNGAFSISASGNDLSLIYTTAFVASADSTYTGGAGNWSTTGNWSGGAGATNGNALIFSGTDGGVTSNDLTLDPIPSLTFSAAAGAYTLNGNALTFGSNGILNSSAATQTIGLNLTQGANSSITATGGAIVFSGSLDNAGYTLSLTGASNLSTGLLLGSGTITKTGAGTLTLNGAVATTTVNVTEGTLALGAVDLLANTAALTLSSGATFDLGGFSDTVATYNQSGNATLTNGTLTAANYNLTGGTISGNLGGGTLTAASGTTTLSGVIGATTVNISGGTLITSATNRLDDTAALTLSAGTLTLGGNDTVGSLTLSGGTLGGTGTLTATTYDLNSGTLSVNLGAGTLNLNATQTLSVTSASAAVNITAGTTTLGSANRLTGTPAVTLSAGTTLTLGGAETIGSLAGAGTLANAGFTLSTGGDNTSTGFSGTLSGTGGLTKTGSGNQTLSNANTFNGATLISGGTLTASITGALGNTSGITVNASTLSAVDYNTNATLTLDTTGSVTISGTALTIAGVATNNNTTASALNFTSGSGTITLASLAGAGSTRFGSNATITGGVSAGTVTVVGLLTGTLSGGTVNANTLNSTSVTGGTNTITDAAAITSFNSSSGSTTVNGVATITTLTTGTLNLNGATASITTLNGGTVTLGSTNLTVSTGSTNAATDSGSVNTGSGGTLTVAAAQTLSNLAGSGTVNANAAITVNNTSPAVSSFTGTFTGSSALNKSGTGTLSLGGNNSSSYSGAVNVSAGVVKAATTGALGSGTVTLSAGSILGGSGATTTNSIVIGTAAIIDTSSFAATANLLTWDFSTVTGNTFGVSPFAPTSLDADLTSSGLTRGAGMTNSGSSAALAWGGNGLNSASTAAAITAGDFATFTINAPSKLLRLGTILAYRTDRSGAGPTTTVWQYQVGSGDFTTITTLTNATSATLTSPIDLSGISALQGVAAGTTITFRLVNFGASGTGGNWYLRDITSNTADFGISGEIGTGTVGVAASGTGTLGMDVSGTTTFSTGTITVNNTATLDATLADSIAIFQGVITGAGSITKTGAGIVKLSGANDFSGGLTISAGTLQVGEAGTTGTLGSGAVTNNAALIFNRSDALSISNIISGTGSLTQAGAGNLTLSGANTYSGATTVSAGTLTTSAGALASTTSIAVNGAILSAVSYNSAATLTLDATATATITGNGLTVGALTNANVTDADALNFTGTGTITVASLSGAGKTTFGANATITGGVASGIINVTGLLTADITGGTVSAGSMTGNVGSSVTVTGLLTGNITDGTNSFGSLSATTISGGTNTVTGTGTATITTISGGTTSVGGVATITTLTAGTANLNGATSSITTLNGGTIVLGTTTLTVSEGTYAGGLSGATGSLIKDSSDTLTLSGANTYVGATTVSAGVLAISHAAALGTDATGTTVADGAELRVLGGITVATEALTLNGAGVSSNGALRNFSGDNTVASGITLASAARIVTTAGTLTLTGAITGTNTSLTFGGSGNTTISTTGLSLGTGALTKTGTGLLLLSVANTYSGGTTISGGSIKIGVTGALGSGAVNIGGVGTLDLNNLTISNAIVLAEGATLTGGLLSVGPSTPTTGKLEVELTGALPLEKTDSGRLELAGLNTFTGATSVSGGGTIAISDFGNGTDPSPLGRSALANPANLFIGSGATLEFTGDTNVSTARSFTIAGSGTIAATGDGALTFNSSSVMRLTGAAPELTLSASSTNAVNYFAATLEVGSPVIDTLTINGVGQWVIGGSANRFKDSATFSITAGASLGFESGSIGGSTNSGSPIAISNNAILVWSGNNNTDDVSARLRIGAGDTAKLNIGSNNVEFVSAPQNPAGNGAAVGSIQKQGTGTLTIAGSVNAAALAFDVPTGKLTINGMVGNVGLSTGATLGGSGTVGTVTTQTGSTVSAGNSPGTLTIDGNFLLAASTILRWEVQDALDPQKYDQIHVTGNLDLTQVTNNNQRIVIKVASLVGAGAGAGVDLGAPLNFNNADTDGMMPRTFDFIRVDGGITFAAGKSISDVFSFELTEFQYTNGGSNNLGLWSVSSHDSGGDTYIRITAVPEPSTYGFGLGALALAAAAIRRRKQKAKVQA